MELITTLLCDDGGVTKDGKVNVKGMFNDLWAPGFPARRDKMMLVAGIEWDREDEGRFTFKVDLVDPAGRPIVTLDGHTDVDKRTPDKPPARTWLVMKLEDVVFRGPGMHRITVRVKGKEMTGSALHVLTSPAEVASPAGGRSG
jgi:hypothetical protein